MLKIRELRLCVHCLKTGHEFRDCTEIPVCSVANCGKKHNHLFHGRPTFASLKEPRKISVNVTQTNEVDPATLGATASVASIQRGATTEVPEESGNLIALDVQGDFPSLPVPENPVY